jgi:hypothetical protein
MIKLNDRFSFEPYLHSWRLEETFETFNKKTQQYGVGKKSTYHANLQQLAEKVVFLSGENVSGDLDDLKAAWFTCVADIRRCLEGEVND